MSCPVNKLAKGETLMDVAPSYALPKHGSRPVNKLAGRAVAPREK